MGIYRAVWAKEEESEREREEKREIETSVYSSRRMEKENRKKEWKGRNGTSRSNERALEGTRGVPDGKVAVLRTQRGGGVLEFVVRGTM